jgi:hypothetical protein
MFMFPFMGNGHEPAGHKGVDDGQKENQGGDQIERLHFSAIFQNRPDAAGIRIVIALQAARKISGVGRYGLRRGCNPRPQDCKTQAAQHNNDSSFPFPLHRGFPSPLKMKFDSAFAVCWIIVKKTVEKKLESHFNT